MLYTMCTIKCTFFWHVYASIEETLFEVTQTSYRTTFANTTKLSISNVFCHFQYIHEQFWATDMYTKLYTYTNKNYILSMFVLEQVYKYSRPYYYRHCILSKHDSITIYRLSVQIKNITKIETYNNITLVNLRIKSIFTFHVFIRLKNHVNSHVKPFVKLTNENNSVLMLQGNDGWRLIMHAFIISDYANGILQVQNTRNAIKKYVMQLKTRS